MQKVRWITFVALLAGIPFYSFSQTTLGDKMSQEEERKKEVHPKKIRNDKPAKIKRRKVQHTPEFEYYARVEQIAKQKQRMMKKMDSPQYYNPLYFGHKRPPKRHEPHKMRYCKECGIRH